MENLHLYLLLLLLAFSIFNKYIVRKLKNLPPTPFSALIVFGYGFLFNKPIHRTLARISDHHGPILLLRFGIRRVLLISSSSAAEDLFSKSDVHFANRPKMLAAKHFGCDSTNLAWAPHGDHWKHLRRVACTEILPAHSRPDHLDTLADEVRLLLGRLFENGSNIVELKPLFQELVLNVMTRMFIGKRYWGNKTTEVEDEKESNTLWEYVIESFRLTTEVSDIGYFMPPLKWLGLMNKLERSCKKLQEKGDSIMDSLIDKLSTKMHDLPEELGENEKTVIEFLLKRQKDDPKCYSDDMSYSHEKIKGLVLVLMSAGTDTTAGLLEWGVSLLLNHPKVLRKAQIEIDNYVGNDRFLDQSDIDHLPYLNCIVKETMRMYPAAPLLVPHESSQECTVGGYHVPKDTMLMVNVWAIHRDPKIWPDEPKMFKPERFENNVTKCDGFKLMPFGYGRRSCPGKHMAVNVITLALGSLIHSFDLERVNQEMVDLKERTGLALFKARPLEAVCHPRLTMVNQLSKI